MNSFKRELILFSRSGLFLYPLIILIQSVIYIFVLKSFQNNILDIELFYSITITLLALIIPLFVSKLWLRERQSGIDSFYLLSDKPLYKTVSYKILSYIVIFSSILVLIFPVIYIFSRLGYIDFGKFISINLYLILYISFAVSFIFLLSTFIRNSIVINIIGTLVLITLTFSSTVMYGFSGTLIIKDFISVILLCIFIISLSISFISRKLNIKNKSILLLLIVLIQFVPGRLDFTSNRKFTLSDYSKNFIEESDSSYKISYYYSRSLYKTNLYLDIENLINQYRSKGFIVTFISSEEDNFIKDAHNYGAITLDGSDDYSFIVVEDDSGYHVIPTVPYTKTLEYEIFKVLNYLKNGELKRIAILIGDKDIGVDNFSKIFEVLSDNFLVEFLFPGDVIPKTISSLLIVGHYNLNENDLVLVGDYLASGGNILVAGTGLPTEEELTYRNTPMLEALKHSGVLIEPYLLGVPDSFNNYPLNVNTFPNRLLHNPIIDPYSGFLGVYLSPVLANDDFETLLTTSKQSWLVDSITGLDGVPEGEYVAAVYGEKVLSKFFPGKSSSSTNKIVVLGNSISLTNYTFSIGVDFDYSFIVRSLYKLNGDDSFIYIKYKSSPENTFYKIEKSLYRSTIFNFVSLVIICIYPIILFLLSVLIKKRTK